MQKPILVRLFTVNCQMESGMESKQYKSRWSQAEEIVWIQAVIDREESLFGSMSGCGPVKSSVCKKRAWNEVASILNSQFFSQKRDDKDCKKKFSNFKSKTKLKLDMKHKTGGGPAETFNQAEELLLQHIGNRASVSGLECQVDTDGDQTPGEASKWSDAIVPVRGDESDPPSISVSISDPITVVNDQPSTTKRKSPYDRDQRKCKKWRGKVLADETLTLDKERILLEKEKITLKMELMREQVIQTRLVNRKTEIEIELLKEQKEVISIKKEVLGMKLKGFLDFNFS